MELIDRSALVAEIERRKYQFVSQAEAFHSIGKEDKESYFAALASNMNSLLSFLDTIEVKEVDLEKYYHDFLQKEWFDKNCSRTMSEMMAFTAKHFFELGLKTQKGE